MAVRPEAEVHTEDRELDELRARLADTEDQLAAERRKVMQMAYAYRGLHSAATKTDVKQLGNPKGRPLTDEERSVPESAARANQHLATFAATLAEGGSLPAAMARMARNGSGRDRIALTRSVTHALQAMGTDAGPAVAHAGAIGEGLLADKLGLSAFAWANLSTLPPEVWTELVPGEYLQLAAEMAPQQVPAIVDTLLADGVPLRPEHWLELVRIATGLGLAEHLGELRARFDAAAGTAPEWAEERAWLDRWVPRVLAAAGSGAPTPVLAPDEVAIGVMTYAQPDLSRTSTNVGDFVQTIGSLSHLVRHSGARFDDSDLGRFAAELAGRVPDSLRVDASDERPVRLFEVDRDASHLAEIPDGTWLLGFGWYAHTVGGVRHAFPFDPRVRPLFVSFHVNRRSMLTEETIDYLSRHAPIGCRDWSTVDLLLSLDVPAFFSGCLTTTVRYVQPDDQPKPGPDAPVVYVDAEPPSARDDGLPVGPRIRNERPEVALRPAEENLREALEILDGYATEARQLVTKRLHCYLPARALGRPVEFVPRNLADTRFNGLSPLTDDEVHAMGAGLADLLEPVFAQILAGADEATVRATWSEVTADRVAAAEQRRAREVELPAPFDLGAAVSAVHGRRVRVPASAPTQPGEPIDVVLALDGNLKEQFLVVVDSLVRRASRPLRLHVLCRDHTTADFDRVAALFGEIELDWLPCDSVDYGEIRSMLKHITISTMDRLLLPVLLPEVERVLYHDIDALPVADVVPLFETDLGGAPLGARDSEASLFASGFSNVYLPAKALSDQPERAFELIRRELARHPYDYVGFNAGVLVLDLARMRADDFCARFLPYASEYGMNDQHILNCYVGDDRARLAPEWNARPSQERVGPARIVHWAGGQKPWESGFIASQDVWRAAEADLAERRSRADV